MARKMTLWGIGPTFALISIVCFLLCLLLHYCFVEFFTIRFIPHKVLMGIGAALVAIGIPFWILSGRTIVKGFNEGRLMTTGVYGIVRHPLYASFIVCVVPGAAFLLCSWILFVVPIVMYAVFSILIRKEEEYLEAEFGEAYRAYKSRVGAVFPHLWRR